MRGSLYFFFGVLISLFFGFGYGGLFWSLSFGYGCDLLSWSLVVLRVWLGGLVLMSGGRGKDDFFYIFLVNLLVGFLVLSFLVLDYIWFYFFFESSLIPIVLIILGWGYQPERLIAGVYLMFYTLFGSLPLLLSYLFLSSCHRRLLYGYVW